MKISLPALQHKKYLGPEKGGRLHTYFQRNKNLHFNEILEDNTKRLYNVNALGMEVKGEKRAILNKVCEHVQNSMKIVDDNLKERRKRLGELLEKEYREQMLELLTVMERAAKLEKEKKKMEKIQMEQKMMEQSSLVCVDSETKLARLRNMSNRVSLKELQKVHLLQMQERQNIQKQDYERERMWHGVMLRQHQEMETRNQLDKLQMQHLKDTTKRVLSKQIRDTQTERENQEWRVKNDLYLRFKAINETIDAENQAALQRELIKKKHWNEYFKHETAAKDLERKAAKYPHPLDLTRIATANHDQRQHEEWQMIKKHRIATQEEIFCQHQTDERKRQKILEEEANNFARECINQKQQSSDQEKIRLEASKANIKQKSIAILQQQLQERDQALRESQLARLSASEEARRSAQRSIQEEYEKKVEDVMKKMDYAEDLKRQMERDCVIRRQDHQQKGKRLMSIA